LIWGIGSVPVSKALSLIAQKIEVADVRPASNACEIGVTLGESGYIQQLDMDALHRCACDNDWNIQIEQAPGDFITPHTEVLTVLTVAPLTEKQGTNFQYAFATGNDWTEVKATTYIADQLVKMIARAPIAGVQ
jgi:uncharacterized membrane protein